MAPVQQERSRLPTAALTYGRAHAERSVVELMEVVRFPSVSAQPKHANDLRDCAGWLATHLRSVELKNVSVVPTVRHPIVYADWRHAPGQPTVLIYGHYDVQPANPHRPNEKFHLPVFRKAIHTSIAFLHEVARRDVLADLGGQSR